MQIFLDTGCKVRMIGLHFSSAFDHINHEAFIFKLRQMGIGGTFLNIIIETLTGRKQRMVADGQCSDYKNVISVFLRAVFLVLCCLPCILVTCDLV